MERKSMPSTHDVLDEARDIMQRRLAEIDDERKRLERALAELGGKAKRSPGRPRGSASSATPKATSASASASAGTGTPTRRRRKRRGGTRADQAVDLIASQPGISASDVAKTMKIKPNYLYRVLGDLEKEGRVKKDGRQYYPTATSGASDSADSDS
jgi:predicted Rossmann fold nucleotide-binding protein DprA/Smf involved in DNA uptake